MPACCTIAAGFDVMNSTALYIALMVRSLRLRPAQTPAGHVVGLREAVDDDQPIAVGDDARERRRDLWRRPRGAPGRRPAARRLRRRGSRGRGARRSRASARCSSSLITQPVGFDGLLTISIRVFASIAARTRSRSRTKRSPSRASDAGRGSPPDMITRVREDRVGGGDDDGVVAAADERADGGVDRHGAADRGHDLGHVVADLVQLEDLARRWLRAARGSRRCGCRRCGRPRIASVGRVADERRRRHVRLAVTELQRAGHAFGDGGDLHHRRFRNIQDFFTQFHAGILAAVGIMRA